jgi:hypothetical protein
MYSLEDNGGDGGDNEGSLDSAKHLVSCVTRTVQQREESRFDIQMYRMAAVARNCLTVQLASPSSSRISAGESCGGATGWVEEFEVSTMLVADGTHVKG